MRDDGVAVFLGVPYGADTRTARFMPPSPVQAWQEIRSATEYGPASPQTRATEAVSEDCLRLNVWTPDLDHGRRPVAVYIHGGEFSHGSGSDAVYNGVRLCRRGDIVVVTLNHRLSALGHLYLAKLDPAFAGASGNVGLLDLVLALRWVRDNIAAFGGDPRNVTLFGQSGGGAKIASLMAMPAAAGLFRRAMTMSGQQITASGPAAATARARAFLGALNLAKPDRTVLQTMPIERLVEAENTADTTIAKSSLYFGPVLDGTVLPRHPFYPDASPLSNTLPMIIGNTREETRAFFHGDQSIIALDWSSLGARLTTEMRVDIDAETVIALYRRLYPAYSPTQVFFAATTASRSWRGAVIEAELRAAAGAPTYVYQLDWATPVDDGTWGAAHTLDIPLVFDNTAEPSALSGDGPDARRVAEQMSAAFIAFTRTGDPNAAAIPAWPRFDLATRPTMMFDVAAHLANDPRGEERRLFETVPYIQRGTI